MSDPDIAELIIALPGPWASHSEAASAIAAATGDKWLLEDDTLRDLADGTSYPVHVVDREPDMADNFRATGVEDEPALAAIDDHKTVMFLRLPAGTLERVERAMAIAADILDAGALGVFVVSSLRAHTPADWRELLAAADEDIEALYDAFVTIIDGNAIDEEEAEEFDEDAPEAITLGMQIFGLGEVAVDHVRDPDNDDPLGTVEAFSLYLIDGAEVEEGDLFTVDEGAPVYQVGYMAPDPIDEPLDPGEPAPALYGTWVLFPYDEDEDEPAGEPTGE